MALTGAPGVDGLADYENRANVLLERYGDVGRGFSYSPTGEKSFDRLVRSTLGRNLGAQCRVLCGISIHDPSKKNRARTDSQIRYTEPQRQNARGPLPKGALSSIRLARLH
jgi:hypothetical protein